MQQHIQSLPQDNPERVFKLHGDKLVGSRDTSKHLRVVLSGDTNIEQFAVIFLDAKNRIITSQVMFKGSLTSIVISSREIAKRALELDAAAIIVGHNHPSNSTEPSQDDINATTRIAITCRAIDVMLHDHIIIAGKNEYYSFSDTGIL